MNAKLTRNGDHMCIVIEQSLLDATGIDADTPLEVTAEDGKIVVTPLPEDREEQFRKATAEGMQRYGEAFRRLANS